MTSHNASAVLPIEWPKIKLGKNKFTLRYSHRSKVVVGERHGSLTAFIRDIALASQGLYSQEKLETTILLAGLRHESRIDEDLLDELVGTDFDTVQEAAFIGLQAMAEAWGWQFLLGDEKDDQEDDDDLGEAEAGDDPASAA